MFLYNLIKERNLKNDRTSLLYKNEEGLYPDEILILFFSTSFYPLRSKFSSLLEV